MSDTVQHVAGFVLAGGRSNRMGEDKALVELAGRPLVAYAVEVLRAAGLEPRIAGARTDLSRFAPVIADEQADRGPLGGVVSALAQAAGNWAAFVSVDMPLMAPELVAYLVEDAQRSGCTVTVPAVNGFAQTFPAVIRRDALPVLRRELERNAGGCYAAYEAATRASGESVRVLPAEILAQAGQVRDARGLRPGEWFRNVNTRDDLTRVSAVLAQAYRIF